MKSPILKYACNLNRQPYSEQIHPKKHGANGKENKMGRTLPTTTQLILDEQRAFLKFRRGLRREDQLLFDELFARARKHIMAIAQADHVLPFEAILLAMLIELMHDVSALKEKANVPGI